MNKLNTVVEGLKPYAKSIVGFVAPGAVLLGAALTEASPGGSTITAAEWGAAAVTCIVTAAGVWGVPNKRSSE